MCEWPTVCEEDRVCEVAVHTGDVSRHAGACGCVSRCENEREWDCVQFGSRDTREYECEACMAIATATVAS